MEQLVLISLAPFASPFNHQALRLAANITMLKKFMTLGCLVAMIMVGQANPIAQPQPDTIAPIRFIRDIARVAVATADDFILTPISNILTGGRGFFWQRSKPEPEPAAEGST
ncbi:hypothetical protein K7432_003679 [Basidiobolus ranarum]|uniref:Uncharacterized protein n=1 Tax=Basidiobolus ranarum TaxID=34480 RepID=A0ABR2WZF8_9FUNG